MNFLKKAIGVFVCFCLCMPSVVAIAEPIVSNDSVLTMDRERVLPEEYGENLVAHKLPLYMDYKSAERGNFERTFLADYTDNLNITNGNPNDSWHMTKQVFADYNGGAPKIYKEGETACRFTFKLDCETDLSAICLINHSIGVLMAEKYEIYASTEYRKLFWAQNRVAYVSNPDSYDRQILTLNKKGVTFVGINVIFPCQTEVDYEKGESPVALNESTNNYYTRISEFAVYGTEGAKAEFPSLVNSSNKTFLCDSLMDKEPVDISKSFLCGVQPQIYTRSAGETVSVNKTSGIPTNAKLTDGAIDSGDWQGYTQRFAKQENGNLKIVGGESHYMDIVFDAGAEKELGVFYLRNHDRMALRMFRYRIFASNSPYNSVSGGLTSDTNLIADCYNNTGAQDNYFIVPENQSVKARYYCVRIYDSCFDYSDPLFEAVRDDGFLGHGYPRIYEISAFSMDSVKAALEFKDFYKIGNNFGYVKPGTKVKFLRNSFIGRGQLRVEDSNGNLKAPSEILTFGDKVIADSDFGKETSAKFNFCGDLNGSGSFTISDIWLMADSILKGTDNPELSDVDCDGDVTVTDVLELTEIIVGNTNGIVDTSPELKYGQRYGVDSQGKREIAVDMSTVLKENFRGFGANHFTSTLTNEGMKALGYNKVYHELTKKRFASMKPSVSRIWFQVDWIVTNTQEKDGYKKYQNNPESDPDYKNYKNGIYDFESEQMQAFCDYIEMLNDYGSTIEINFGWKTGTRIQYWFNMPCQNYKSGAPKDLPAFGKAAAALIKYLNEEKGYDFIEAITFYNEPNTDGDFESDVAGDMDERIHWCNLVREAHLALEANGMRDKVEIWGPEVAAMEKDSTKDWFAHQLANAALYVDQWTGHKYYHSELVKNNYSETFSALLEYSQKTKGNMLVTEMYSAYTNDALNQWCSWNDSFASYYIAVSNVGLNGFLTWTLMGGYLPDPSYLNLTSDESSAWHLPRSEKTAAAVNRIFYEESIFSNYIPDGSKVLYTEWVGDDIRASAYLLPDGNVTVVVENNGINENAVFYKGNGVKKNVVINLSDGIDRTFKRISYITDSQEINANATVNRPDITIEAKDGKFSDTLGDHCSVHIYTTAPTVKQVEMESVFHHVKPGRSTVVKGKMLDCDAEDEIVYSITEYTGANPGTVLQNGLYTADSNAESGDMVAVRATLKSDPKVFGVSIIYID